MKAVLVALNSQYIHKALAVRSLQRVVQAQEELASMEVELWEGTINEDWRHTAASLYARQADLYAFSVYIWNVELVAHITRRLRQLLPQTFLLWGGPEVSYDCREWLENNPSVDAILRGEAEESFPLLLKAMLSGEKHELSNSIPGLVGRHDLTTAQLPIVQDIAALPFPYSDAELQNPGTRIFYYESTRGCPFNCQYCLSSGVQPLRFRPLEQTLEHLARFSAAQVKLVKLVDRTFNWDSSRAMAIWNFLLEAARQGSVTTWHFELSPLLLDDAAVALLSQAPPGLFQFEIGVQSTHPPTLEAIQRYQPPGSWHTKVRQLRELNRQHLHLDLIAGLPLEGWEECSRSLDEVMALKPHQVQLGFLKMLRGSGLRQSAEERGDIFSPTPPYEILKTKTLSHRELLKLQQIAALLERYYNSGRFKLTLQGLEKLVASHFHLFLLMSEFWQEEGYPWLSNTGLRYQQLASFAFSLGMPAPELYCRLAYDFCLWYKDEVLPPP
ncbi:MAG: B12-binding domain-containing radical SAM protein, partial [Symbiobacteriaceae bacterium]|nr:B12-binding domain-containing radical SAM protein [Symbiobacteriaceae bacterium]